MREIPKPSISIVLLGIAGLSLLAQSTKMGKDFPIDVNRPFVYVQFDHIGPGTPRSSTEPNSRIWLRLRNNCRIAIVVSANGVPDDSPKNEVGLEYDVVANRPVEVMVTSVFAEPDTRETENAQSSEREDDQIPRGYMEEVASTVTIPPGQEILFSMPINHLSKRWHVEIPFDFELPAGKGPRNENTGGLPVMVVYYSLWDLPASAEAEVLKK